MSLQELFYKAIEEGDLAEVKSLVKRGPVVLKMGHYFAFRRAAENGNLEIVQFLSPYCDHGALDYNAFRAATENGHREVANFLQQFVPWSVLKDYV